MEPLVLYGTVVLFLLTIFAVATMSAYLSLEPSLLKAEPDFDGRVSVDSSVSVTVDSSQTLTNEVRSVSRTSLASETVSEYPVRHGSNWAPDFDIVPLYHSFDPFGTRKVRNRFHLTRDYDFFYEDAVTPLRTHQLFLFKMPHPLVSVDRIDIRGRMEYEGEGTKKSFELVVRQGGAFGTGDILNVPISVDLLGAEKNGFHLTIDMSQATKDARVSYIVQPEEHSVHLPLAGTGGMFFAPEESLPDDIHRFKVSGWTGVRKPKNAVSIVGTENCGWAGCKEHNAMYGEPEVYLRNTSENLSKLVFKNGTSMIVTMKRPTFLPGVQPEHHHVQP